MDNVVDPKELYKKRYEMYGPDNPRALGWGSRESQELRFEALSKIIHFQNASVLDFGCGTADLCKYLRNKTLWTGDYYGIDVVEELIEAAQAKLEKVNMPGAWRRMSNPRDYGVTQRVWNHDISEPLKDKYDYCLLSGTLNDRVFAEDDWIITNQYMGVGTPKQKDYVYKVIDNMWQTCEIGMAFNLRSSWAWKPKSPEIVVYDPTTILEHCKEKTSRLSMTHAYLPHDFTVYMFKEPWPE